MADPLQRAGALEPYDDRLVLAFLYERYSTVEIAEDVCDSAVTSETIAYRLHLFGLTAGSTQDQLAELDPEEIDPSPSTGEGADPKFRRRTEGSR